MTAGEDDDVVDRFAAGAEFDHLHPFVFGDHVVGNFDGDVVVKVLDIVFDEEGFGEFEHEVGLAE